MKTVEEFWRETKWDSMRAANLVAAGFWVIDVRRGIKNGKYQSLEWAVMEGDKRIADGFETREAAVFFANEKASSGEPKA